MRNHSFDLSTPIWTDQLAGLLERASIAIGRLDARVSASSVQAVWLERVSWTGFAQARRAQGVELDEIDVFALACGVVVPGRRPLAFADDEARAVCAWQRQLSSRECKHWRDLVPCPLDLPDDWRDRPALLRAVELIGRHARDDRTDLPWLGSPALLVALGLTKTPLPCLVVADKAMRLAPHDRDAILRRALKALAAAAVDGLQRLHAAEADRLRAAQLIAAMTRPGRMPLLIALLHRRPLLSPLAAARALKMTISGAGKLLARAAGAGLAVEISGRAAWKIYMTPDLAAAFGFVRKIAGRPPALPDPRPLDAALARFDTEMAGIDARLAELGVITALGGG